MICIDIDFNYFWFGLNSALRLLRTSAMAMRIVTAITITITTATIPPMMATVLSEVELPGAAAVGGCEVVVDILVPPGPTGAAKTDF